MAAQEYSFMLRKYLSMLECVHRSCACGIKYGLVILELLLAVGAIPDDEIGDIGLYTTCENTSSSTVV